MEFKKEKFKNLKNDDPKIKSDYEEAKKDYEDYKGYYENEKKESINELSENELILIKKLYRKASRLCHPDVIADEYIEKAIEVFQKLNTAYRKNDLNGVNLILDLLEKSEWIIPKSEKISKSILLKSKIKELENKRVLMIQELNNMKNNEEYIFIKSLKDWKKYFQEMKNELNAELIRLKSMF